MKIEACTVGNGRWCNKVLVMVLVIVGVSGCTQVKPWQRGTLAKPEMQGNPDPLVGQIRDHIYFSKEASSGSTSAGGGGCGCN